MRYLLIGICFLSLGCHASRAENCAPFGTVWDPDIGACVTPEPEPYLSSDATIKDVRIVPKTSHPGAIVEIGGESVSDAVVSVEDLISGIRISVTAEDGSEEIYILTLAD